ncbi:hypothetical protein [Enterococcus sp. YC2-6]|uniref:hypothetical protein n=1 Tax=Enterococcus sp. YC2-6 TaxID=2874514 RepID=UPI00201F4B28|nr:hypothetical protein [Enterococcus sp. YC2-6]
MANKQLDKGNKLEFRSKRLLFHMGYYVTHGILLKTSNDIVSEEITDLDVFGIRYTSDFRSNKIWLDCKSGKIKTMERLTWINGIKNYLDIDEVLFVARSKKSSLDYASALDIQVFDTDIFTEIEKRFNIDEEKWYGSCNPDIMLNINQQFKSISISGVDTQKISDFFSADYWIYDSFTSLKKTIAALRELSKFPYEVMKPEEKKAYKWAIYTAIILFTNSLLKISREVFYLKKDKREEYINQKLIASDIPIKRRNEIFDSAVHLITQRIQESGNIKLPPLNISPPSYSEPLNNIIERLINAPHYAEDILRAMDLVFLEFDMLEKEVDEVLLNKLIPNYVNNKVGIKLVLHFVHDYTGIDKKFLKLIS